MAVIKWSEQSSYDLKNIGEFIAKDSEKYAVLTVRKIRLTAKLLKVYPFLGRIVPEIGISEIRELIIGNYRLIYKISPDQVSIITVHNSSKLIFKEIFHPIA